MKNTCKDDGMLDWEKWYQYQAELITEAKGNIFLRDFAIQTDRKINSNRSDIVVKNYKRKHAF